MGGCGIFEDGSTENQKEVDVVHLKSLNRTFRALCVCVCARAAYTHTRPIKFSVWAEQTSRSPRWSNTRDYVVSSAIKVLSGHSTKVKSFFPLLLQWKDEREREEKRGLQGWNEELFVICRWPSIAVHHLCGCCSIAGKSWNQCRMAIRWNWIASKSWRAKCWIRQ